MDVLTFTVCPQGVEETREVLQAFLEALTTANELYFRRLPAGPCCPHCAGVKYKPPTELEANSPGEHFESAERMVVLGEGACGPIAAMVAARMRALEGRRVRPLVVSTSNVARRYHVVVELEDGTTIDPTTELEQAVSVGAAPACACEVLR